MLQHRNRIPVPFADVRIATVALRDKGFPVSGVAELLLANEAEKETTVGANCADLIVEPNRPVRNEIGFGGQVLEGTGERHTRGLTVQQRNVDVTLV